MAVNQQTLGRDITVTANGPNGNISFPVMTMFNLKQSVVAKYNRPINGPPIPIVIPQGLSGSIEVARTGPDIENFFIKQNADYYAGLNESPATITGLITEPDGSITTRKLKGVMFYIEDLGSWKADDTVSLVVQFIASTLE